MPNKTIYVAEEDLPLLEEAQALTGGNLSSAIARALRGYVDAAQARQAGFSELTVRVGPAGSKRLKRFWGYQMARWQVPHADGRQMEVFTIYRTKGGRLAVHWRKGPNWGWWAEDWSDSSDWMNNRPMGPAALHHKIHQRVHQHWGSGAHGVEETLEVFETMEELKEHIPPELFQLVTEAGQEPRLEDLDI
ncbi:MAG TPA: EXLDI protein [Spirochaetia bacterium]|nr:EXLDI protein [Spirochaetia bacterium]